jgi:hypothetical protein
MNYHDEVRKKDAMQISFFFGAILMILFVIVMMLLIPSIDNTWTTKLFTNLPTFRFMLVLIIVLISVGVNIKIFKTFKINYLFIFELDPNEKMTHI